MMGLDRMDSTGPYSNNTLRFQQTLPPTQSQLDLGERRKAFWVLFIFDAYASVRSGTTVAIDASKVTTALPTSQLTSETSQTPMPSLDKAQLLYGTGYIPSFTGLILMASLYGRCLNHVKSSLNNEPTSGSEYSFWEHHYAIDKELQNCYDAMIGARDAQTLLEDEVALALNLNLCGIDICLHETAIIKAEKDKLPKALVTEGNNRCSQAAMRIADGVFLSQQLPQPKKTLFRQMNIFCMWPLCMAIQVLNRQLSVTEKADMSHILGVLKLLVTAMEDLEDVGGHWMDSIAHIVRKLENMESNGISTIEVNA